LINPEKQEGLVIWEFDFALSSYYEIELEAIENLVHKRLSPVEVAPGIALIALTALNFPAGALGHLPEFQELIFGLVVTPDLSRGVPKFAMHILSLSSTNLEHLEHCVSYYKLPVFAQFSCVNIQKDPHAVDYEDDNGLIATMKNVHPNPVYEQGERYFQAFVEDAGELYVADVLMRGSLFEHQNTGDTGTLYNHPFFRGIDMEEAEPVAYMQMFNEPGSLGQQYYPRPVKFG
jgi:hypothetical protein